MVRDGCAVLFTRMRDRPFKLRFGRVVFAFPRMRIDQLLIIKEDSRFMRDRPFSNNLS